MQKSLDDTIADLRNASQRTHTEYKIHRSIIDHITGRIKQGKQWIRGAVPFRGVFITHIYNGRSANEGFFLKELGVVPGVADLLSIWRNPQWKLLEELSVKYNVRIPIYEIGFIEVKSPTGTASTPQRKFKGFCHSLGINWALARSKKDAHQCFVGWGLEPLHGCGAEADLRTKEEKWADSLEMFRPK